MKKIILLLAMALIYNACYSQVIRKESQRTVSTKGWIKKLQPSNRTLIDAGLYTGMASAFLLSVYGAETKNVKMYKAAAYVGGATITLQICNMSFSKERKSTSFNKKSNYY